MMAGYTGRLEKSFKQNKKMMEGSVVKTRCRLNYDRIREYFKIKSYFKKMLQKYTAAYGLLESPGPQYPYGPDGRDVSAL